MENFDVVTETPSVAVVRALLNPNVQNPNDDLFAGLDSASQLHRSVSRASSHHSRQSRHSQASHHSHHSHRSHNSQRGTDWQRFRDVQEVPRRDRDPEYGSTHREELRPLSRGSHTHSESYRGPTQFEPMDPHDRYRHEADNHYHHREVTPDLPRGSQGHHRSSVQEKNPRQENRSERRDPDSSEGRARRRALFERAELNQWEFENNPEDAQEHQFRDSCGAASMLSDGDIVRSKHMVLMDLKDLEHDGVVLTQKYTIDSNFDDMHCELLRQRRYLDCRQRVNMWTIYIKMGAFALEIGNIFMKWYVWSPLNLDGFGNHMLNNTGDIFHLPLKRCYYKYVKRVSDSPLWDLGIALGTSIALFHFKGQLPQWISWFSQMTGNAPKPVPGTPNATENPANPAPASSSAGMGGLFSAINTFGPLVAPMINQYVQQFAPSTPSTPGGGVGSFPVESAPSVGPPRAPFGITLPPPLR